MKSKRTVSRYIKAGLLNPERIKNKLGTLEYRFNRNDLLKFKKTKRPKQIKKTKTESGIITFLKEQLKNKDDQINKLLERSRETNILLNRLQNQLLLTGDIKEDREDRGDKTGQGINGWLKRFLDRKSVV